MRRKDSEMFVFALINITNSTIYIRQKFIDFSLDFLQMVLHPLFN